MEALYACSKVENKKLAFSKWILPVQIVLARCAHE
jgi:hypothetical protein